MQIFALETDIEKIRKRFVGNEDEHVMMIRYHWLRFVIATFREVVTGAVFITIAVLVYRFTPAPLPWVLWPTAVLLLALVIWPMLKDFIDWKYDFVEVTKDKVVIVDQSSIFRQRIKQINMENFASVEAETQLLNLFPFGRLHFSLKEGVGDAVTLHYIPNATKVADTIADAVSGFQRRREFVRETPPQEVP